jgi:ubiquinol-cytochrome c reductase cytochrome c subunit
VTAVTAHPRSLFAVLLLAAAVVALLAGGPAGAAPAQPAPAAAGDPAHGRTLYLQNCASCHGQAGEGTQRGPSLIGVGAAAADFYLQTGRMPLAQEEPQAQSGPPKFAQPDIADLDAYVASLGPGPAIPAVGPGDPTKGGELYLQECAACHGSGGAGYTQVGGRTAPSLLSTRPQQVAEAVRVGPSTMPGFPENVLDQTELDDVVSYVQQLQRHDVGAQGGADLARLGPVTETIVGFAGLAVLLVVVRLMGKRSAEKRSS